MLELLNRYWIKFDFTNYPHKNQLSWYCLLGYGVTAYDLADALKILREVHFGEAPFPPYKVIENVKMTDLDQNHVVPNINVLPFKRGVWYPGGMEFIR